MEQSLRPLAIVFEVLATDDLLSCTLASKLYRNVIAEGPCWAALHRAARRVPVGAWRCHERRGHGLTDDERSILQRRRSLLGTSRVACEQLLRVRGRVRSAWRRLESALQRLGCDASLRPGLSLRDILEAEATLGFRLPADLAEALLVHNGMLLELPQSETDGALNMQFLDENLFFDTELRFGDVRKSRLLSLEEMLNCRSRALNRPQQPSSAHDTLWDISAELPGVCWLPLTESELYRREPDKWFSQPCCINCAEGESAGQIFRLGGYSLETTGAWTREFQAGCFAEYLDEAAEWASALAALGRQSVFFLLSEGYCERYKLMVKRGFLFSCKDSAATSATGTHSDSLLLNTDDAVDNDPF